MQKHAEICVAHAENAVRKRLLDSISVDAPRSGRPFTQKMDGV